VSIEGELRIELQGCGDRVEGVRIHSSRPLGLPKMFRGKGVEEVLRTLPLLYSVCATAQACAAARACRQALGIEVEPRVALAEELLVGCETLREHLWRILIDWPDLGGEALERVALEGLSKLMAEAGRALFGEPGSAFSLRPELALEAVDFEALLQRLSKAAEQTIFGTDPAAWWEMGNAQAFHRWIDKGATPAARLLARIRERALGSLGDVPLAALPELPVEALHRRLEQADAEDFMIAPEWEAEPRESNCLTRQIDHPLVCALKPHYGHGLMTRMVARLVELAGLPRELRERLRLLGGLPEGTRSAGDGGGVGLGVVEAARGRLFHRVRLEGERIAQYQILAPTEWNFHSRGVVAQGLLGLSLRDTESLRRQAALLISAVDPCVGYRLKVA